MTVPEDPQRVSVEDRTRGTPRQQPGQGQPPVATVDMTTTIMQPAIQVAILAEATV